MLKIIFNKKPVIFLRSRVVQRNNTILYSSSVLYYVGSSILLGGSGDTVFRTAPGDDELLLVQLPIKIKCSLCTPHGKMDSSE